MFEMKNKNANDDKSNDENSNSLINIHKTKEEESIEKILNLQKKIPYLKIIIFSCILILIAIIIILCVVLNKKKDDNIEKINVEKLTNEEINLIMGEQTNENYKMIKENENNIEKIFKTIENYNSKTINKIDYNENNLNIPSFLTNSTPDSDDALKISIIKKDIDIYNKKYKELSEKTNEYTQNMSESINKIPTTVNNLKDEINKISNQFEETMKNLCVPFILEQKDLINNIPELSEKMIDYKNQVSQLNSLYNTFFRHIKNVIDTINKEMNDIPDSVIELNNYINERISDFKNLVEQIDKNNSHNNLNTMKDSFIELIDNLKEKKNIMEENINNFEKILQNNQNILQQFQNDFNELINIIIETSNLIIEEVKKENKIEIDNKNPSKIIVDSILNSITSTYEVIIQIHIKSKNQIESIIIIINVESKTSLDLLFIMDLTGSMEKYLNDVKANLIDIIDKVIDQTPGIDINLGFIGYSDIPEEGAGPYIDIDFTQNHSQLSNQINDLTTYGGGDTPEDVAWAFEKALIKTWKSNAKFIVFVADGPGHGLKYYSDDTKYPNGIEGRKDIEESVEELVKDNVSLFCVKINDYTQKMFNIFQDVYNKYNL